MKKCNTFSPSEHLIVLKSIVRNCFVDLTKDAGGECANFCVVGREGSPSFLQNNIGTMFKCL